MSKELKRRGFRFVGPTTAYALMQATGMVDDHLAGCHVVATGVAP
jgi:DNA-3-methyladenine glycosylase I